MLKEIQADSDTRSSQ